MLNLLTTLNETLLEDPCLSQKPPLRTHLYEYHKRMAKMTQFAGFDMPLWYTGIISEHLAVRNNVGLFDITHMGRALITGSKSEDFLNYVTTNDVGALAPLSAQYSTLCNDRGGIIDDLIITRLEQEKFLAVYNAANRQKDYQWLIRNQEAFNVEIEDVSDFVAMFAVQGPKAEETLQKISSSDLSTFERFKCNWTKIADQYVLLSRTGYTGEDGFEVFVWNTPLNRPTNAEQAWNTILQAGESCAIQPCGLGARDTLRLEAGLCLYGNDIDEETTPLEAGASFAVKFKKESFVGRVALIKQKAEGIQRKRVGLRMLEKGIPRNHNEVWKNGARIGDVTSGTFSPILRCGIAMAYVPIQNALEGEKLDIRIRDKTLMAEVVKFPFYDPKKYGHGREK